MTRRNRETARPPRSFTELSRRNFLLLGSALSGAALLAHGRQARAEERTKTRARIVIAGAGAAGLSAAAQLASRLDGAEIVLLDARKDHYYQPGFTLVAGGLKSMDYTISATADYIPPGVKWIPEAVAEALAPVPGDQQQPALRVQPVIACSQLLRERAVGGEFGAGHGQRIDHGIACDRDSPLKVLAQQIAA